MLLTAYQDEMTHLDKDEYAAVGGTGLTIRVCSEIAAICNSHHTAETGRLAWILFVR